MALWKKIWQKIKIITVDNLTLVHKKSNFCKNRAKLLQSEQLLQNSCKKIYLTRLVNLKVTLAKFLNQSCNTLFLAKILLELCFLNIRRKAFFERFLQDSCKQKFPVYTLHSDDLCVSPKSKHNQPLEVKFDELYTCWTYFVIEHL